MSEPALHGDDPESRRLQRFPVLSEQEAGIARQFAESGPHRFPPGAMLFDLGAVNGAAWLVIEGSLELMLRPPLQAEQVIATLGPRELSGEVGQLAGRASLALGRAGPEGCTAMRFDPPHLRGLILRNATLGEIVMRSLILRRVALIDSDAGPLLIGSPAAPDMLRLQVFLTRNGYPHHVIDSATPEGQAIIGPMHLAPEDLPLMLCATGARLRRPSDAEAARCIGMTPPLEPGRVHDVVIVGAGPSGLAAAVYAASEGLHVIVVDSCAMGGQAGASARIENFLGFPTGISGQALAGRAFTQAMKFGVEVALPMEAAELVCPSDAAPDAPIALRLAEGGTLHGRTVVIASGARYRRLAIDNLADFEGNGVSYWASPVEARLCRGEEIALVGGGNSAGQAVVFLAPQVKTLHMVVRGAGLAATMSQYLVDRIEALPNVVLHRHTEVVALDGDRAAGLTAATFRDRETGETRHCAMRHLFLFVGAEPNTGWLQGCVDLDPKGFVLTGSALGQTGATGLQTSRRQVFAIGDVRAGSIKRVAAAVGDGAAVVAQIHAALAAGSD